MDTLITIKPFDLENKVIRKNTTRIPGTIRKVQIDNEAADSFRNFNKEKKGVISSDVIYAIKPELVITFPKYEEKISLNTALKRLAISNALITEKYGRKDLKVTPEQLQNSIDREINKNGIKESLENFVKNNTNSVLSSKISSLENEIEEKNKIIDEQQQEISELKRKEIVYKTVIEEYEDKEQLEEDIKLIA